MIVRENYVITGSLYDEAVSYAKKARAFTSNRHDFHSGGLSNKERKMFEGKLGEKAVKLLLIDNNIRFIEDTVFFHCCFNLSQGHYSIGISFAIIKTNRFTTTTYTYLITESEP